MLHCKRCDEWKPYEAFSAERRRGFQRWCKACFIDYGRERARMTPAERDAARVVRKAERMAKYQTPEKPKRGTSKAEALAAYRRMIKERYLDAGLPVPEPHGRFSTMTVATK